MYIVIIKFNRLNYFGKKRANWIFYVASSCLVIDHNGLPRNSWFPRNSFTVSFEEHCRRCKIRCKRRGRGGGQESFFLFEGIIDLCRWIACCQLHWFEESNVEINTVCKLISRHDGKSSGGKKLARSSNRNRRRGGKWRLFEVIR